jgi:hypothetical protein
MLVFCGGHFFPLWTNNNETTFERPWAAQGRSISGQGVGMIMRKPPLDPPVNDQPPEADVLTGYDQEHLVTYLRLLDAETEGADWVEVARIVLHIDPSLEPERARRAWESHLARAKWMTQHGYCHLLRDGAPH